MSGMSDKLLVHQRIGYVGLSIMLITTTAFSAFSMSMFTPSLPTIADDFGTSDTATSVAVTIFFVFYSIGTLLFGSVSDKFGRKATMLGCMILFLVGSIFCAVSTNLPMLLTFRVVAALGAGGAMAVDTAIVNDVFAPEPREKFLMFMAMFQVVGPVVAPIIGALIVTYASWHMLFVLMAAIGMVCFVPALLFNETLPKEKRIEGGIFSAYTHMGPILRNKSFMVFLVATMLPGMAQGTLISVGSYIYIDYFGLSETGFGCFYAVVAGIGFLGPVIYNNAVRKFTRRRIISTLLWFPALASVLVALFGHSNPFIFTLCYLPVVLSASAVRPAMTAILLQQYEDDAGSASGMINFANTIAGAIGMGVTSLFAFDFLTGISCVTMLASLVSGAFWLVFSKSNMKLRGLEDRGSKKRAGILG